MAQITFEVLDVGGIYGSGVNGSGLGFYGSGGFGTSVPLFSYQGTTFLTNSAGGNPGGQTRNNEFISGVWGASGLRLATTVESTGMLTKLNSNETTLMIHFDHDTKVQVQNCQLRIYDRDNVDAPASGVITKVAEVANFGGASYATWVGSAGNDFTSAIGSGDAFWWGAPWKKEALYDTTGDTRPYYQNSVGVKFYNFTDKMDLVNSGNPDIRLTALTYPAKQTVGGTGIIVPLLDSPCSGGRGLASGAMYPKFVQYVNTTYQGAGHIGMGTPRASGDVGVMAATYGGTSGDFKHSWRVAISAAPLSIGSKTSYGMYISLEYL
jgi:hypothetical protein